MGTTARSCGFCPAARLRPPTYSGSYSSPPFGPPPTGQPRKSRKPLVILAVTLPIVLIGGGIGAFYLIKAVTGPSDEDQIKTAINGFAEAVDTADVPQMLSSLCSEEAEQITGDADYEPDDSGPVDPIKRLPVDVSDIQVNGATAQLSRPPAEARTLKLKHENGT